jgi:hypothetical protein
VPNGTRWRVKKLLKLVISSTVPNILDATKALIIASLYSLTVFAILVNSLFGTTANKVSSNVKGKNFCFQL